MAAGGAQNHLPLWKTHVVVRAISREGPEAERGHVQKFILRDKDKLWSKVGACAISSWTYRTFHLEVTSHFMSSRSRSPVSLEESHLVGLGVPPPRRRPAPLELDVVGVVVPLCVEDEWTSCRKGIHSLVRICFH